jgi:hypothetical protein
VSDWWTSNNHSAGSLMVVDLEEVMAAWRYPDARARLMLDAMDAYTRQVGAILPGNIWNIGPNPNAPAVHPSPCQCCRDASFTCREYPLADGLTEILCALCRPGTGGGPCLCSACCMGMGELCDSLPAPEAPRDAPYLAGDQRQYTLPLTGQWIEVGDAHRYRRHIRVRLPEGEQVPCGWSHAAFRRDDSSPHCPGWAASGWAVEGYEPPFYEFRCDACMGDLDHPDVKERSRAVPE